MKDDLKFVIGLLLFTFFILPSNAQERTTTGITSNSVAVIPFEQIDHLIYLPVTVNGTKLRFVLDGGSSVFVIDPSKVKELGVKTEGKGIIRGAGKGSVGVSYADSITYDLNAITITVPKSTIIDLSNVIQGQKIDGIVGYDLFEKYVVEINYHTNTIRLFDPKTFAYSGNGSRIPITIKRKQVYAHAKIKIAGHTPETHEFIVDSGSSDNVDDTLIAKSTAPKTESTGGVGIGQTYKVTVGYIEEFKIGKYTLNHLRGTADAETIGNGVLHNYTVIFDYGRKQMILE